MNLFWKNQSRFARTLALGIMGLAAFASRAAAQLDPPKDVVTEKWEKAVDPNQTEPFWGKHQGGIATKPQHFLYFAVFDLTTNKREDVIKLLKAWTEASARMSKGETAQPLESGLKLAVPPVAPQGEEAEGFLDPSTRAADTGETLGMPAARLTLTFGFGTGLFTKDGKDRYGLAAQRPEAFVDMPNFGAIDQIPPERAGGDLAIQACAEDPQVAFHAIRQLARIGEGIVQIRWVQTGYRPIVGDRHLLGFSAEEKTPGMNAPEAQTIWAGNESPAWMRGGSYIVVRRIRFAVEHWDQMPQSYQEIAVGEMKHAHGVADASKTEPSNSTAIEGGTPPHLAIVTRGRDAMLRRSYSYNDGVNFISERWPPWRQGLEYDAGMFFICFQRNPQTGFIGIFKDMANHDSRLNQFWTHVGSGLFAVPHGAKEGGYIGEDLFTPR